MLPGINFEIFLWSFVSRNMLVGFQVSTHTQNTLTSEKYVTTTVRSENLRPASDFNAAVADSTVSNLT